MSQAKDIKEFLLENIPQHPNNIVPLACKKFSVTPTTVHRHLNTLTASGEVLKTGKTRQITYTLASSREQLYTYDISSDLEEEAIWEKIYSYQLKNVPANVYEILHYGITEIINNAIDHSEGRKLKINVSALDVIEFIIEDNGIGIFEKIHKYKHFEDYKECLLHLTKGKLTTDPNNHTGEGIFFSSRIFDRFIIEANGLKFIRDNKIGDWSFSNSDYTNGTRITAEINANSTRNLKSIFDKYTELDDYDFVKTEILVDLSRLKSEYLMSRSQAKRVVANLEEFNIITLDFSKIKSIGQGFADEIFRVYQNKFPHKNINYTNANDNVEFMIKRAIN